MFKISLLLNVLDINKNYFDIHLSEIENIYIPLKFFGNKKYEKILKELSSKSKMYIYLPAIVKGNYNNLLYNNIENAIKNYEIHGLVVSNIGAVKLLNSLFLNLNKEFKIIANYTFNVFNSNTILELEKMGIDTFTISPELDKDTIDILCKKSVLPKELIVYGRTPLINMNYCLLGESDKCYPKCSAPCKNENNIFYLKDRLNMKFPIIPDNIQTVTTIFNSKITSISATNFNIDYARIDILEENVNEINKIIETVKNGKRLEGKQYTNGNLNRTI